MQEIAACRLLRVIEADALALILDGELPAAVLRPDRVLLGGGGRLRSQLLCAVLAQLLVACAFACAVILVVACGVVWPATVQHDIGILPHPRSFLRCMHASLIVRYVVWP